MNSEIDIKHHATNSRSLSDNPFEKSDPRYDIWINVFKECHDYLFQNDDEDDLSDEFSMDRIEWF